MKQIFCIQVAHLMPDKLIPPVRMRDDAMCIPPRPLRCNSN